jgi:Calpain family cysteine protease
MPITDGPDPSTAAETFASTIGAANPLTLAELRLGRTLDPSAAGFQEAMSQALGLQYEKLFDPRFSSPVFASIHQVQAAPEIPRPVEVAAVLAPAGLGSAGALPSGPVLSPVRLKQITIPLPVWWPIIFTDLKYAVTGEFIVDVPTATSAVQGALGDCWLISAMASVAWCHSDAIGERTLKDGSGVVAADGADYEFTFYASPSWATPKTLSVKDDVPVSSAGQYIYARSSVPGETWPANIEKAFIGMRGATGILEPSSSNYDELSGGDPAWAVASLVGRPPYYYNASNPSAWSIINSRCTNGVATEPMTAWTYGTGSATISYNGSGIVANHAYSILGTETAGGQDYVILRNPWGWHEGTLNTLGGTWQGLTLPVDGVFALRADTFGQYYAGFGGA